MCPRSSFTFQAVHLVGRAKSSSGRSRTILETSSHSSASAGRGSAMGERISEADQTAGVGGVSLALLFVSLQQLAGDHELLDLAGPLADQQERGIPVETLDRVLGRVPVAAVDPERLG